MGVQELWSSRVLGSSAASTLPFLVVVDLGVRDVGRVKVAALEGRGARKRILLSNSFVCRGSSFDRAGCSDGPATQNPTEGAQQKLEAWKEDRDAFRSAPPAELIEDEFFSRMNLALEASRHASSRASSTSAAACFDGSASNAACEPPRPSAGHGMDRPSATSSPERCELPRGGVQLPSSIQKLRRRKGEQAVRPARETAGCSIKRAFSSLVYMIKAVQSHALQIRQAMFSETWNVQEVLHLVHKEMHSSFVWLFQRVFACTPKLMVSVMILLANFTVFSMGENLAIAELTPPAIAQFLTTHGNPQPSRIHYSRGDSSAPATGLPSPPRTGSGGNVGFPGFLVAEGFDDDSWLAGAMKEQVQLAQEIETRRLVAPHLEADNYGCFDRTDLDYQLAIAKDPLSPVLLANYAQFLFIVRRDHNRAEEYFHRAMEVDPRDSTILDRFASFLWLGRGDRSAAERVFIEAMNADPNCSYNAGSYAHFLWHAGDGDTSRGRMAT